MDSLLFRTLSVEELHSAARHYFDDELCGWELLRGGLFNTTYRLDMERGSVILRLGPVHREVLLPYERGLMASEPVVQNCMLERGIPTSKTVLLDLERTFLDRDVAAVEPIRGASMTSLELEPAQERSICRKAGALTSAIHSISAFDLQGALQRPFGRTSLVLADKGSASWKAAMLDELHQWAEMAEAVSLFPEELFSGCIRCFEELSPVFEDITEPRLVHGDIWYGNLLVHNGELRAIIDDDRSFFGDPDFDLMLPWMPAEAFMEGYGIPLDMSDRAVLRRKLYRFLLLLEDSYILKVEYRDREGYLRSLEEVRTHLMELSNDI